jgi:hypothetical protein
MASARAGVSNDGPRAPLKTSKAGSWRAWSGEWTTRMSAG